MDKNAILNRIFKLTYIFFALLLVAIYIFEISKNNMRSDYTVYYTHLDVYKRQTYYIITDKSNTQMRFNIVSGQEKAWLGGLRDSMENTVTLTYNAAEGQIAKITDPAGRETNFYYTNNLLSSITTPAAESGTLRTVYFTYATACLLYTSRCV